LGLNLHFSQYSTCFFPQLMKARLDFETGFLFVPHAGKFLTNSSINRFTTSGLSVFELCPAPFIHSSRMPLLLCHFPLPLNHSKRREFYLYLYQILLIQHHLRNIFIGRRRFVQVSFTSDRV
jgi:hypothetical protein